MDTYMYVKIKSSVVVFKFIRDLTNVLVVPNDFYKPFLIAL